MQDENQQVEESVTFTCEICTEPTSEKPQSGDPCSHPFCTNCMAKHIAAKLELGAANIPCPDPACDRTLDPITWGPLVGPSAFNQWCDALCEDAIADLGWHRCPHADCGAVIVNECGGRPRKSKCPDCRRWFCFECGSVWHEGLGCEEARDENDVALERLAERRKWMRCPRCRRFVERNYGCWSIKCRCRMRFCYGCGNPIDGCTCEFSITQLCWYSITRWLDARMPLIMFLVIVVAVFLEVYVRT